MKPELILTVGPRHIHVCEVINGAAHIAWSGRVPVPTDHGAIGCPGIDPDRIQSINGDEPWIADAVRVVAETPRDYTDDHLHDAVLRPRFEAAGVPLV